MDTRLICCRTPLQALIASRIQEEFPARDFILYYPTSDSPKHRAYFEKLKAESKFFCDWQGDGPSYILSELSALWRSRSWLRSLPNIRRQLVSSFDSTLFAAVHGLLSTEVQTFDDGFMNLSAHEMNGRIEGEPKSHRLVKRAFGGKDNRGLLAASAVHYTIFSPDTLAYPFAATERLSLLPRSLTDEPAKGRVTVLVGTTIAISKRPVTAQILAAYQRVIQCLDHQVFLAHPGDEQQSRVSPALAEHAEILKLTESLIAEEVILRLVALGYRVKVYAFGSTTLLNVAGFAEVYNLVIDGVNEHEAPVFERLGVPAVPCEQVCSG